jgi:hypothetical protein
MGVDVDERHRLRRPFLVMKLFPVLKMSWTAVPNNGARRNSRNVTNIIPLLLCDGQSLGILFCDVYLVQKLSVYLLLN